jgi:hypothetical protein
MSVRDRTSEPGLLDWAEYRRRRNVAVAALLGWLSVIGLPFAFPTHPLLAGFWWVPAPFVFAWAAWATLRLNRCPCPHCGAPFFMRGRFYGNTFARKCLNCGTRKFEGD